MVFGQNDGENEKALQDLDGQLKNLKSDPTGTAPKTKSAIEKRGFLFERKQSKSFVRVFCAIENGKFTISSYGKQRGYFAVSEPLDVILCEVKVIENVDKRFTFTVISAKKSFVFQAESEEEMNDWMKTFETAKKHWVYNEKTPPTLSEASPDVSINENNSLNVIREFTVVKTEQVALFNQLSWSHIVGHPRAQCLCTRMRTWKLLMASFTIFSQLSTQRNM